MRRARERQTIGSMPRHSFTSDRGSSLRTSSWLSSMGSILKSNTALRGRDVRILQEDNLEKVHEDLRLTQVIYYSGAIIGAHGCSRFAQILTPYNLGGGGCFGCVRARFQGGPHTSVWRSTDSDEPGSCRLHTLRLTRLICILSRFSF